MSPWGITVVALASVCPTTIRQTGRVPCTTQRRSAYFRETVRVLEAPTFEYFGAPSFEDFARRSD
jgi:hypothetical protein